MNYIIVHINMIIVKTVMKDKVQFVNEDTNINLLALEQNLVLPFVESFTEDSNKYNINNSKD